MSQPVFGLDQYLTKFPVDYSPMFAHETIEKTETHIIYKDEYGVLNKNDVNITSLPMELEHPVKDWKSWNEYKQHYSPESIKKRLPPDWKNLTERLKDQGFSYKAWRDQWGIPRFSKADNGAYHLYDDDV